MRRGDAQVHRGSQTRVVHERSGRWVQSAAGGGDHYSGDLMETFTWAGAVAAVTERIGIISTVHVTVNHPVRREGLGDGRSDLDGRAGMNLVLGWYPADIQLFGYELSIACGRSEKVSTTKA
jgi:dimethylsulfone monooxygenase